MKFQASKGFNLTDLPGGQSGLHRPYLATAAFDLRIIYE